MHELVNTELPKLSCWHGMFPPSTFYIQPVQLHLTKGQRCLHYSPDFRSDHTQVTWRQQQSEAEQSRAKPCIDFKPPQPWSAHLSLGVLRGEAGSKEHILNWGIARKHVENIQKNAIGRMIDSKHRIMSVHADEKHETSYCMQRIGGKLSSKTALFETNYRRLCQRHVNSLCDTVRPAFSFH